MESADKLDAFAPLFEPDSFTEREQKLLSPFFTNLTDSVYVPLIFSPEIIGALSSRTSRAAGDLRKVFLAEYMLPFLSFEEGDYSEALSGLVDFLQTHSFQEIFSNPKARSFYATWLAQYGDDSIAQMAGAHVVFASLSNVVIKYFEDQRIGLAPIEKSTRYVDYGSKVKGQYQYYTDPTLAELGFIDDYRAAMDLLFATYVALQEPLTEYLTRKFPAEKPSVVEKKVFDTLRGLLPASALSQVAFFGNGQALEYMIARGAQYRLGEVRWAASRALQELEQIVPSFLRRLKDPASRESAEEYQQYLARRNQRVAPLASKHLAAAQPEKAPVGTQPTVTLLDFDGDGEVNIITAMLYSASANRASWADTVAVVQAMNEAEREDVIHQYLAGRTARWQKVGRALEQAYLRYEIVMNIGAWRDLHRHRMLSQQRQQFTIQHGYDVPPDVVEAGLAEPFIAAIDAAEAVYEKIATRDHELAQYAVTMAHRVRFIQWTNVRECFWEMELRTIPEGHPDYRHIEQEKFRLFEKAYPLLARHMRVNMGDYDFARRGQEEKMQEKLESLNRMTA